MSIATAAARGAIWTMVLGVASRAIGLISTLIITRYVAPGDYGELSVAVVLAYSVDVLTSCNLFQYILAKPDTDRGTIFHATFYNFSLILLGALALVALRGPLGQLLDAPTIVRYVPGLALTVVIERITFAPARILWRDLRYGTVRLALAVGDLVYTAVTIGFAVAGWGAMSMVVGNLARCTTVSLIINSAQDRREWLTPVPLRWEPTKRLFAFGLPLSVGSIAGYAASRWDNLIVARLFGPAAVGLYSLAYNLAELPASYLGDEMATVLLPAFARLEPDRRSASLVRATALLALVVTPVAGGLAAIAETLVSLLFDARWSGLAPLVAILSASALGRVVASTVLAYLPVRNRTGAAMWLALLKIAALFGGLAASARLGLLWACGVVAGAFTLHAIAGLWVISRIDGIPLGKMIVAALRPLLAATPMVAAVMGLRRALLGLGLRNRLLILTAQIASGGVIYFVLGLLFVRETSLDLLRVTREAISRRRRAAHSSGATEPSTVEPPVAEPTPAARTEGEGT